MGNHLPSLVIPAGRHLELRPLRLLDAKAFFALTEANRDRLRRWLPWVDDVGSVVDTRAFIAWTKEQAKHRHGLHFGIWWKGEPIGVAGFNAFDRMNRMGTIGYWISAHAEGRGLMTRAVTALLKYGFEVERLHRIEIRVAIRNRASRAIPERLGFRHEGTLHGVENLYGKFMDHAVYGMLAQDWER